MSAFNRTYRRLSSEIFQYFLGCWLMSRFRNRTIELVSSLHYMLHPCFEVSKDLPGFYLHTFKGEKRALFGFCFTLVYFWSFVVHWGYSRWSKGVTFNNNFLFTLCLLFFGFLSYALFSLNLLLGRFAPLLLSES